MTSIYNYTRPGYDKIFEKVAVHEIGHTMGLGHAASQAGSIGTSVMGSWIRRDPPNVNDENNTRPLSPGSCDRSTVENVFVPNGGGDEGGGTCGRTAPARCSRSNPCCESPIVLDMDGNGFNLTSAEDGVHFDVDADGSTELVAWTSAGSDDSWLVLDRDGNGRIDDGSELFGNHTAQAETDSPNGFLALAEFDDPADAGNNDDWITRRDGVFAQLQLWNDANHNGTTDDGELTDLAASDILGVDLDYHETRRIDEHGNAFSYRSKVRRSHDADVGRWAYDVFLGVRD